MVDEITPTYYAAGDQSTYTLIGHGFDVLPDNALGIRASHNDDPLENQHTTSYRQLYDINERSDTRIVLSARYSGDFTTIGYIGCIVSNDRNYIYWVNDSQPLPTNRGDSEMVENIDER